MRRRIKKNKEIIITLIFVGIFTAASFIYDQRVVQQENTIRNYESKISESEINIQKNSFLINSLFDISKEITFSGQNLNNTLDEVMLRRHYFYDFIDYPELYKEFKNYKPFKSGDEGFKKLAKFHDEVFLDVLKIHNKAVNKAKIYLDIFKKNKNFLDIINDPNPKYDFERIKNNLDKYFISEKQIANIPFDEKIPYDQVLTKKSTIYSKYSEFRDIIHDFSNIGDDFHGVLEVIIEKKEKVSRNYDELLIEYSNEKNKKNFFILLSIFFQILSLTSLMLLFKIIINQEKL